MTDFEMMLYMGFGMWMGIFLIVGYGRYITLK
jgi:hypothetical protein